MQVTFAVASYTQNYKCFLLINRHCRLTTDGWQLKPPKVPSTESSASQVLDTRCIRRDAENWRLKGLLQLVWSRPAGGWACSAALLVTAKAWTFRQETVSGMCLCTPFLQRQSRRRHSRRMASHTECILLQACHVSCFAASKPNGKFLWLVAKAA